MCGRFVENADCLEFAGLLDQNGHAFLKFVFGQSSSRRDQALRKGLIQRLGLSSILGHRVAETYVKVLTALQDAGDESEGSANRSDSRRGGRLGPHKSLGLDQEGVRTLQKRIQPGRLPTRGAVAGRGMQPKKVVGPGPPFATRVAEPGKHLGLGEDLSVAYVDQAFGRLWWGSMYRIRAATDSASDGRRSTWWMLRVPSAVVSVSVPASPVLSGRSDVRNSRVLRSSNRRRKRCERNALEAGEVVSQEGVDHSQNGGFSHAVRTMQKRYAVVEVEVDAMVVDAEEPVDLDSLKPKELRSVHDTVAPSSLGVPGGRLAVGPCIRRRAVRR